MIKPEITYKGGDISGVTQTRSKLQDECKHLRGYKQLSAWYFVWLVCTDCKRPLQGC